MTEETPVAPPAKILIGQLMIQKGMISPDQLEIALKEQRDQEQKNPAGRKLIGRILIDYGFITETALNEILSEQSGTKQYDFSASGLDPNLVTQLPKETAIRLKAIPIMLKQESLIVAMTDIYNIMAIDQIRKYFPKSMQISPVHAQESQIMDIIDQYYRYEMSVDGILREIENKEGDNVKHDESDTYINPTVRLVDAFLNDAIKRGASDIHFEPEGAFLRIRYRIDGVMMQIRSFHKQFWSSIVVRIKIISAMNIAETRIPQDGRISYNFSGRDIDFRVATQPTIHGENIVMRILDKKQSLLAIEELGFSTKNTQLLKKLLKRPEGIIIVTGPTGSGKTTTLYSILNTINTVDKNIMTLEDPVEYQLPLIRQSSIKEQHGLNFTEGIKSLMRQDPDIIFVGEVRDVDSANMAIRAAITGHQVFTTLHTNDSLSAIPRLVDIGIPSTMIAGSIISIIAQRLTRKLCIHCKVGKPTTEEEARILGVTDSPIIYHPVGCEKCENKGYKGRVAVSEVLAVDREMDELIAKGSTRKLLLTHAKDRGFDSMVDDAIRKVLSGLTSLDEIINTVDMTEKL